MAREWFLEEGDLPPSAARATIRLEDLADVPTLARSRFSFPCSSQKQGSQPTEAGPVEAFQEIISRPSIPHEWERQAKEIKASRPLSMPAAKQVPRKGRCAREWRVVRQG